MLPVEELVGGKEREVEPGALVGVDRTPAERVIDGRACFPGMSGRTP